MDNLYLFGAIIFNCIANLIRVIRWEYFIRIYEKPQRRCLIQALSWGYILNYFLPYKLGDLFRAWMAGKKMKNGKALGFSTVVVDRYMDIVSVGIIFVILSFGEAGKANVIKGTAAFYIACAAILVYLLRGIVKKFVVRFAGLFNSRIESFLLRFAWALIWNFKDIFLKINKIKLLTTTVIMWISYLSSYYLLAQFLTSVGEKIDTTDVFVMLFTQSGIRSSTGGIALLNNDIGNSLYMYIWIIYMMVPLLIMLAISLLFKKNENDVEETEQYLNLLPHLDSEERLAFLENYFSNNNKEYVTNYLKINQNISIIRDYSAGSNATTMLCMDEKGIFFRKYAFGAEGKKLYQQVLWIKENANRLALPEILGHNETEMYCYYDMPYSSSSVGLFEYVHSVPIEQGWKMIRLVFESLEKSIYQINVCSADRESIHNYVENKVKENLNKIKNAKRIRPLQQYETIYINGVAYKNLSYYEKYLSEDNLKNIFENDIYAVIHGDLTVENIICTKGDNGRDGFYIIDPNTGNVHDSPNLDYGKLLQSIHGGYEFLMFTKEVSVNENKINFLFTKSSVYTELHMLLRNYMVQNLGEERTKSIYYHEIIHWLRLMPYKIDKDGQRSILFYAGMLMVMNDVIEMYGDNH